MYLFTVILCEIYLLDSMLNKNIFNFNGILQFKNLTVEKMCFTDDLF
jgi:hypothetical protein